MSVELEIQASMESFRVNSLELEALLRGPHGPIAADLARRAIRVESAAKTNASGRPGPRVITGRLRGSITWRLGEDIEGLYAEVGSNVEYALYVEQGTSRSAAYPFLAPSLDAAYG